MFQNDEVSAASKQNADPTCRIGEVIVGLHVTEVLKAEHSWDFAFDSGKAMINIECTWRIVIDGRIAFGRDDHGQKFGLSAPLDGVRESIQLLSSSRVAAIHIRRGTGDLEIKFENGSRLEIFNSSSGYEGWSFRSGSLSSCCYGWRRTRHVEITM